MSAETVSVIIPTYNELENIEQIVDRVLEAFDEAPFTVEVLVMDDSSPDGTGTHAESVYADDSRVRVVHRTENPGLSQAVSEGFSRANGTYCAVIDADLQHPPERLPLLVNELADGADIAIGSRYIDGGRIENWSATRRFVSKGASGITKLTIPSTRDISDPMSGFFAVRRSVLSGIQLEPKGYKILIEILSKCEFEAVAEVPYVFTERERGESKLKASEYQNFAEHALGLSLYSYGYGLSTTPMRLVRAIEFAAVGGTGTFVNMAIFWLLGQALGLHYLVAGAGAFFVAVNWNFVGNWAVTFNRPQRALMEKLLKFYTVSIVGYIVYSGILELLIGQLGVPLMVANIGAIAGSSLINFVATDSYVFEVTDAPSDVYIRGEYDTVRQQQ